MRTTLQQFIVFGFVVGLLFGCAKPKEPVRIAINPWPGYEFLYLAEQQGFFKEVGLNAELVQLGSLSDAQRAYINGYVDGLASTVIEAVQAQIMSENPLKVVLFPDFSNGGDVIISRTSTTSVQQLRGKTVGAEVSSLGLYFIQRALDLAGMSLEDINLINVEQPFGRKALDDGEIDAFMTYPPVMFEILHSDSYHILFSSAEIPGEIIDTVSISEKALADNPDFVTKLHKVWNMGLRYHQQNPEAAAEIMALREGISAAEFTEALQYLELLSTSQQLTLRDQSDTLEGVIAQVCKSLTAANAINANCSELESIIYRGPLVDE